MDCNSLPKTKESNLADRLTEKIHEEDISYGQSILVLDFMCAKLHRVDKHKTLPEDFEDDVPSLHRIAMPGFNQGIVEDYVKLRKEYLHDTCEDLYKELKGIVEDTDLSSFQKFVAVNEAKMNLNAGLAHRTKGQPRNPYKVNVSNDLRF